MEKISEKLLKDLEKAGKQVLDDEELTLINGGNEVTGCYSCTNDSYNPNCHSVYQEGDPYDPWCMYDYCCQIAWHHPDDDDASRHECFIDYICIWALH